MVPLATNPTTFGRHTRHSQSDDSDDEKGKCVLTSAKAAELSPKPHRLLARNQSFSHIDDLSALAALDYIDLTANALISLEGLSKLPRLKTLILRDNSLSNLTHILSIATLRILNIAGNSLASTDWIPHAAFASQLLCLVATGNQITKLEGFLAFKNIKTLILSNNQIEDISPLSSLRSLTKLSLSHNDIRVIPDSIKNLYNLVELRLAHNRISSLPSKDTLRPLIALKIFDLGHNCISSFNELHFVGNSILNLTLCDNPGAKFETIMDSIQQFCPMLEIVDGKRLKGGRRKLRINRLRRSVGFPVESDRRFARPPPQAVLNKFSVVQEGTSGDTEKVGITKKRTAGDNIGKEIDINRRSNENHSSKPRERTFVSSETEKGGKKEEDTDVALQPEEFIEKARSQFIPLKSKEMGVNSKRLKIDGSEERAQNKKKRQKSSGKMSVTKKKSSDFGVGGASKW